MTKDASDFWNWTLDEMVATVSNMVPVKQIAYLSVDKSVCEQEFFAREDHRGMLDNILNTQDISEEEKQRRIDMRRAAAINAFHENAKEFGIETFIREETGTVYEMAERIERHFLFYHSQKQRSCRVELR